MSVQIARCQILRIDLARFGLKTLAGAQDSRKVSLRGHSGAPPPNPSHCPIPFNRANFYGNVHLKNSFCRVLNFFWGARKVLCVWEGGKRVCFFGGKIRLRNVREAIFGLWWPKNSCPRHHTECQMEESAKKSRYTSSRKSASTFIFKLEREENHLRVGLELSTHMIKVLSPINPNPYPRWKDPSGGQSDSAKSINHAKFSENDSKDCVQWFIISPSNHRQIGPLFWFLSRNPNKFPKGKYLFETLVHVYIYFIAKFRKWSHQN